MTRVMLSALLTTALALTACSTSTTPSVTNTASSLPVKALVVAGAGISLPSPIPASYVNFGFSVAIDGQTAVVSVFQGLDGTGHVYAYRQQADGSWALEGELTPKDAPVYSGFGVSLAISGDTVAVGAQIENSPGYQANGSVYIFTRTRRGWVQQQKLLASDRANTDYFGTKVDVSGDTLVVSAPGKPNTTAQGVGAVYVFTRSGARWSERQKFTVPQYDGIRFGDSVAVSGTTVVVGSEYQGAGTRSAAGAAYVYTGAGQQWSGPVVLQAPDAADYDFFGHDVDVSGSTLIVGAPWADVAGVADAGAAYVYGLTQGAWNLQAKLISPTPELYSTFGKAVRASGDRVLVGASSADGIDTYDSGAAYLFNRAGVVWPLAAELRAPDAKTTARFGDRLGLTTDAAVVGAPYHSPSDPFPQSEAGAAYVFPLR